MKTFPSFFLPTLPTFPPSLVTQQPAMPKAMRLPDFPLSGLVPIEKPSGPTSMRTIDLIKPLLCESALFHDPSLTSPAEKKAEVKRLMKHRGGLKIGQGGTLDPLADGVLVIGVGKGTKLLSQFLHCTKVRSVRVSPSLPLYPIITFLYLYFHPLVDIHNHSPPRLMYDNIRLGRPHPLHRTMATRYAGDHRAGVGQV